MALIPPHFVDSVVAIGHEVTAGEKRWIASGFLYGKRVGSDDDGKPQHRVYLVTNRHVLADNEVLFLRCNPAANAPARDYPLVLRDRGRPMWFGHPDPAVDVGVVPIRIQKLRADGLQVAYSAEERDAATTDRPRSSGVSEGDHVFVLGFRWHGRRPAELGHRARRVLARVRDVFDDLQAPFWSTPSSSRNSGGPVVSAGDPEHRGRSARQGVPDRDLLRQHQLPRRRRELPDGRQRVLFEDNADWRTSTCRLRRCIQMHLGSGPKTPPVARRKSGRPPPP